MSILVVACRRCNKSFIFRLYNRSCNRMSERKATGIQKPLNVSAALAKIIGTKKGEQVT